MKECVSTALSSDLSKVLDNCEVSNWFRPVQNRKGSIFLCFFSFLLYVEHFT